MKITVKELQEWEHYDEFIKLRREVFNDESTETFLAKVEDGRYNSLGDIVLSTATFSTMPKWWRIWREEV